MDTRLEDYLRSLDEKIEESLSKNQERTEKKREQIRNPKKKPSFFEKLSNDSELKHLQEKTRELTELTQKMYQLRSMEASGYDLPQEIRDYLNEIAGFLPEQDQKVLGNLTREAIRNSAKSKKEKVDELNKQMSKLLKSTGLENSKMFVKDRYGNSQSAMHNVGYVLDTASSKMKQSFNGEYVMITPQELASSYLTLEEEVLIKNLDELKNFEEFKNDPKTKDVAKNFHEIERELNARAKAEHMNTILINAKNALSSETEVNFSELISYLNDLQQMNTRIIERATKYVEKFDFRYLEEKIREKREQEEKEARHNAAYSNYARLAYELEELLDKDPDNLERREELEAQMRDIARMNDLSNGELQMASIEGKEKYRNELLEQKALREARMDEMNQEHEMKAESQRRLREEAIRLLESRGAFDDLNEVRNGDVYTDHQAVEALIERTMEELRTAPKYTQEQKEKATNIYREYIRYRANLQDKTNYMTFSEYTRNLYQEEDLTEEMVDEEVRGRSL